MSASYQFLCCPRNIICLLVTVPIHQCHQQFLCCYDQSDYSPIWWYFLGLYLGHDFQGFWFLCIFVLFCSVLHIPVCVSHFSPFVYGNVSMVKNQKYIILLQQWLILTIFKCYFNCKNYTVQYSTSIRKYYSGWDMPKRWWDEPSVFSFIVWRSNGYFCLWIPESSV